MITLEQEQQIHKEAAECFPLEGIWLITKKGMKQVENVHEDPENHFKVSAEDSFEATKEGLVAIVHSHTKGDASPSAADMELFEKVRIPCGIISTDGSFTSQLVWLTDEIPEFVGRPFIHGVSDCYSLVRDYYRTLGLDLGLRPRNWNWWDTENLIEEGFEEEGFFEIPAEEVREGDVWLSQLRCEVIHHCGIYMGNELVLHHPGANKPIDKTRMSVQEPIHRIFPYIRKFLRHKDLA